MIVQIEQAILDFVKAAGEADVLGYRYKTLENYPRDWAAKLSGMPVGALAMFVSWANATVTGQLRSGAAAGNVFEMVVAARNVRNLAAARQGAMNGSEVGALQLMEDAIALLQGQTFGLDIGPLKLVSAEMAADLPVDNMAACILRWSSDFTFDRFDPFTPAAEFVGDFETFNVAWQVPTAVINGDDNPILEQTLDLYQETAQ